MITYINTVWVVIAAAMVLFMEGGFSLLEAGLVRTKKRRQRNDENFCRLNDRNTRFLARWLRHYVRKRCVWTDRHEFVRSA